MPSNQSTLSKLNDLTKDPIGLGILISSLVAIVSFILTAVTLFQLNSLDIGPDTEPENVETSNTEPDNTPGKIGDYIWIDSNRDGIQDEGEEGMANVPISLVDLNANTVLETIQTDEDGNYEFTNVLPGTYYLELPISNSLINSTYQSTENKETDNNFNTVIESTFGLGRVAKTPSIVLKPGEDNLSIDGGFHTYEEISGYAWQDMNSDGIKGEEDLGVPGVVVSLLNETNSVVDTLSTGEDGSYIFNSMSPGKYSIKFESSQEFSTQNPSQPNLTFEQLTTLPKYSEQIEIQSEQKVNNINVVMYEITAEIAAQYEEALPETTPTVATEEPGTETQSTPTPEQTNTPAPTPSPTPEPLTPEPTATIETSAENPSTGSGSNIVGEDQQSSGGNLVRTGIPIFILGILGGVNLLMLKYTNSEKEDYRSRRRRIRRYVR